MPFPFQVILVAGATGYLLSALLFLVTRSMPGVNPGNGWWSFSSFSAAVGYIVLLAFGLSGDPQSGEAVYNILFILWVLGLYLGGRKFLAIEIRQQNLIILSLVVILWLGYFYFISYHFLAASFAVALFNGVLNLHLAWLFWKHSKHLGLYVKALVLALTISGLHWLDYPFLRPIESIAPIGFSLCAIISVAISGLLAGMVVVQFRHKMLDTRQKALDAAHHDSLTGLHNRMALESQFKRILENASSNESKLALVFIDLDNFKPINDQLGHTIGDKVLTAVAKKIKSLVRTGDVVARIGGDEFVVILTQINENTESVISRFCTNLIDSLRPPIQVNTHQCLVGASIGVACASVKTSHLEDLITLADKAMYEAKAEGKGCYILKCENM